jgi:hypothetical protein
MMPCKIATLLLLELISTLLLFVCKGAIELSILSEYYGREIAAYDIQTTRCDLYGQVSDLSFPYLLVTNFLFFSHTSKTEFHYRNSEITKSSSSEIPKSKEQYT